MFVAELAQRPEERRLDHAHAALAHDRLDQDRGRLRSDRPLDGLEVAERNLIEAFDHRAEAFEIFLLPAGGERRQRAAVEGAFEGDDAVALRRAVRRMIFARHLDGAFHRLGAGIAEEDDVGKARVAQPRRYALGFRNLVEIGDVPQLLRLRGQRLDQMRMRMAERVDGDAGGKIEIAVAVGRRQPYALAPLESEVDARVSGQQMRCHGLNPSALRGNWRGRKANCAAKKAMCRLSGRHGHIFYFGAPHCQHRIISRSGLVLYPYHPHISRNVWKWLVRTLAPESRHIVAFFLSSTTYRAADSHLKSLLVEYGLGGLASPGVAMDSANGPTRTERTPSAYR